MAKIEITGPDKPQVRNHDIPDDEMVIPHDQFTDDSHMGDNKSYIIASTNPDYVTGAQAEMSRTASAQDRLGAILENSGVETGKSLRVPLGNGLMAHITDHGADSGRKFHPNHLTFSVGADNPDELTEHGIALNRFDFFPEDPRISFREETRVSNSGIEGPYGEEKDVLLTEDFMRVHPSDALADRLHFLIDAVEDSIGQAELDD